MKTTATLLVAVILIFGIIIFSIGSGTSSQPNSTTATVEEIAPKVEEESNTTISVAVENSSMDVVKEIKNSEESKTDKKDNTIGIQNNLATPELPTETKVDEDTEITVLNETDVPPVATNTTTTEEIILERIEVGISDQKMSEVLENISENMEKRKLAYIRSKGQDCSGIFHKIKDSIQVHLPTLKNYKFPVFNRTRSSRQIADWYYQNGNLLIVENPMASRNSIRPGAVMFFAKPNKKFQNMTIEMLTDRDNNYTNNGAIMHIAVVTSVRIDDDGNVIDYTMMHGRNKRRHASRSNSKAKQSKRMTSLPPFGNWSQQWVAIANIATPME